ncbi:MAG: thioredoxin domain-containing protein [Bacillaceae bacterium]|nr:thioredoxin domain-containing protein [Bacillaceae bacterium]
MKQLKMILLFILVALIIGCNTGEEIAEEANNVYYGNAEVEQELLFVFDYSCPWCKVWIDEIFPIVEAELLEPERAKYRSQVVVFVNPTSLQLANFDQLIKENYPEQYYEIQMAVMKNMEQLSTANDAEIDEYLEELVGKFGIDQTIVSSSPSVNMIEVTRDFSASYKVEYVPAIYVNEIKIEDPFNIDEILSHIN